jgi:hypothetical protein
VIVDRSATIARSWPVDRLSPTIDARTWSMQRRLMRNPRGSTADQSPSMRDECTSIGDEGQVDGRSTGFEGPSIG